MFTEVSLSGFGVVQIFHQGVWGTVCFGDEWTKKNGEVVCRELGKPGVESVTSRDTQNDESMLWLSNVSCRGNEAKLMDCLHGEWSKVENCKTRDRRAAVKCEKGREGHVFSLF